MSVFEQSHPHPWKDRLFDAIRTPDDLVAVGALLRRVQAQERSFPGTVDLAAECETLIAEFERREQARIAFAAGPAGDLMRRARRNFNRLEQDVRDFVAVDCTPAGLRKLAIERLAVEIDDDEAQERVARDRDLAWRVLLEGYGAESESTAEDSVRWWRGGALDDLRSRAQAFVDTRPRGGRAELARAAERPRADVTRLLNPARRRMNSAACEALDRVLG